ncbi:proline-rich proteoglycan 2-like [Pteropus medius]|uniref:proline-rich proteoglycan 2-like n=1 Tax=Pteropus vampyrus TaxID=132908 RepID=UPI00196AC375|nr:proline-rich proteoglycan 2-like [Pteropus giganteus]
MATTQAQATISCHPDCSNSQSDSTSRGYSAQSPPGASPPRRPTCSGRVSFRPRFLPPPSCLGLQLPPRRPRKIQALGPPHALRSRRGSLWGPPAQAGPALLPLLYSRLVPPPSAARGAERRLGCACAPRRDPPPNPAPGRHPAVLAASRSARSAKARNAREKGR